MSTAIVIAAVAIFILGLFAVIVERTEQRDKAIRDYHGALKVAREAQAAAKTAVEQAETFADEQKATHAANEILCAELACSDAITRRLRADLIDVCKRLSDYENGAEVIAFPSQREASPYDWPQNSDDEWFSRLYNENGDLR